jgi:nucleotide-binding universal stress UspA family protein
MNILLPVDGSPRSLEAVHHALRLVRDGLKASFVLANVQEPSSLYEMMVVHDPQALRRMATEAGEHAVAPADKLLTEADIDHTTEIVSGDPAHRLLDIIGEEQCNVVIMGAHGEGESGAALGSVAQALLKGSPVPVMIVRPPQESPRADDTAGPSDEAGSVA